MRWFFSIYVPIFFRSFVNVQNVREYLFKVYLQRFFSGNFYHTAIQSIYIPNNNNNGTKKTETEIRMAHGTYGSDASQFVHPKIIELNSLSMGALFSLVIHI